MRDAATRLTSETTDIRRTRPSGEASSADGVIANFALRSHATCGSNTLHSGHRTAFPMFGLPGARVEVRQESEAMRGSWFPAKVVEMGPEDEVVVEYDEAAPGAPKAAPLRPGTG